MEAKLIGFKTIKIERKVEEVKTFFLVENNKKLAFKLTKKNEYSFLIETEKEINFWKDIFLIFDNDKIRVDTTFIALTPEFEKRFRYDGNDLGFTYSKSKTKFVLWAPLASRVELLLDEKKKIPLRRFSNGIWKVNINKNLKNHTYNYLVTNCGKEVKCLDPYGKGTTVNSKANVIINYKDFLFSNNEKYLPKCSSILDAIIYEGHVRDLTICPKTNIKNKGKFLGLVERNRTNEDGYPVGFDYFKSLGITHIQLLPIYDFSTTDDIHPEISYNWGYDPKQYFVPEGNYASNVFDPKSRIKDLLKVISEFHKGGIRVIMDVVFNHVFDAPTSSFEKVVPKYYFRYKKDGSYFSGSCCGNDLGTEKYMTRKLIVDASKFWVETYRLDGYRFDIMGLIDLETINTIKKEVLKIKKDFVFLGEGWNMNPGYQLEFANMNNHKKLKDMSHFNDFFRNTLLGDIHQGDTPGYILGNNKLIDDFLECLKGSSTSPKSKFDNPYKSVNYVECHDNLTLFDRIEKFLPNESKTDSLNRILFANKIVMYSLGTAFFHAGQEIGLSKNMNPNSYNSGDKDNQFDYSLLKERWKMVEQFKELVSNRKNLKIFHEMDYAKIKKNYVVSRKGNVVFLQIKDKNNKVIFEQKFDNSNIEKVI